MMHKKYFCDLCLSFFLTENELNLHFPHCQKFNKTVPQFPDRKYIGFENVYKEQRHGFTCYADCEAFLEPVDSEGIKGSYNKHKVCAIGYYF